MKLSEAITFATENPQFLQLLQQNSMDVDTANGIKASIAHNDGSSIFIEIMVDYGFTGPSSKDVRIRIRFDKSSGEFDFLNVAVKN